MSVRANSGLPSSGWAPHIFITGSCFNAYVLFVVMTHGKSPVLLLPIYERKFLSVVSWLLFINQVDNTVYPKVATARAHIRSTQ